MFSSPRPRRRLRNVKKRAWDPRTWPYFSQVPSEDDAVLWTLWKIPDCVAIEPIAHWQLFSQEVACHRSPQWIQHPSGIESSAPFLPCVCPSSDPVVFAGYCSGWICSGSEFRTHLRKWCDAGEDRDANAAAAADDDCVRLHCSDVRTRGHRSPGPWCAGRDLNRHDPWKDPDPSHSQTVGSSSWSAGTRAAAGIGHGAESASISAGIGHSSDVWPCGCTHSSIFSSTETYIGIYV